MALSAEDEKEILAQLGPGVVGQALASQPIPDPTVYFPLKERTLTYRIAAGPKAGRMQTLGVEQRKRPNGIVAWRFAIGPSVFGFIDHTAEGHLTMPALADAAHDLVVLSTPATPFLLNGIRPGESRAVPQSVSVNYIDDPSRQDYSGSLSATLTYVGTFAVTVPAGTYEAILMRTKLDGKIGPARTTDLLYYFLAPQVGVVAMISQEDLEAFWVVHVDKSVGKVLASVEEPDPAQR